MHHFVNEDFAVYFLVVIAKEASKGSPREFRSSNLQHVE
jgi:hypothetical protein